MTTRTHAGDLIAACAGLDRAELALQVARTHPDDNGRYVHAHTAALRVAAAVLAVRADQRDVRGRRNVWDVMTDIAPELGEWALVFSEAAHKRRVAGVAPRPVVSRREADDLVRAAEQFAGVVEHLLGLTRAVAQ